MRGGDSGIGRGEIRWTTSPGVSRSFHPDGAVDSRPEEAAQPPKLAKPHGTEAVQGLSLILAGMSNLVSLRFWIADASENWSLSAPPGRAHRYGVSTGQGSTRFPGRRAKTERYSVSGMQAEPVSQTSA